MTRVRIPSPTNIVLLAFFQILFSEQILSTKEDGPIAADPNFLDDLIWNGCEPEGSLLLYGSLHEPLISVKPTMCTSRRPAYLQNTKPQKMPSPFQASVTKATRSGDTRGIYMLTILSRPPNENAHKAFRLKMSLFNKSRPVPFKELYIVSGTNKDRFVGSFHVGGVGQNELYDIGYCCGDSRDVYNLYVLHSSQSNLYSAQVLWSPLNFTGQCHYCHTSKPFLESSADSPQFR